MPENTVTLHAPSYHFPPDRKDREGRTPLYRDVEHGDVDRVRAHLLAGARPNVKARNGYHALFVAVNHAVTHAGDERMVALLLEHGARVDGTVGAQALVHAARHGLTGVMHRLLSAGVDVNARDEREDTALTQAVMHGQEDAMRWLLDRGALTDAAHPSTGWTALMAAARRLDTVNEPSRAQAQRMVASLLDLGADPNRAGTYDGTPQTPVLLALSASAREAFALMANSPQGVDLQQRVGGVSALGAVMMRRRQYEPDSRVLFDTVLAMNPPLNDGPVHGHDPALHCALYDQLSSEEKAHRVRALLDAGADPMARSLPNGVSFLESFIVHAFNGKPTTEALRSPALLDRLGQCPTLDLNLLNHSDAHTLLMVATNFFNPSNDSSPFLANQALRWLLDHGASVNVLSGDQRTVLGMMVDNLFTNQPSALALRCIDTILGAHVDWTIPRPSVAGRTFTGGFLAHAVALAGHSTALMERCLRAGMPVDQRDAHGNTPLHAVASCGFEASAQLLIDAGADVSTINDQGLRPHDYAQHGSHAVLAGGLRALYERQVMQATLAEQASVSPCAPLPASVQRRRL